MAIPNYQQLLLPVLQYYGDQQTHELREASSHIADVLQLSAEDRTLRTSSGTPVINNRVSWAHTYLKRAGLLESIRKGVSRIAPRGLEVLASKPTEITNQFLSQYPEFLAFKQGIATTDHAKSSVGGDQDAKQSDLTPEEQIDKAMDEHKHALIIELLDTLRKTDPVYFEQIVLDLLGAMGYGVGRTTKVTGDGGIDGIIDEDALGLSQIYVQAKRYASTNTVNGKEIRDFFGALALNQVSKGVFITTSHFNTSATQATPPHMRVVFIDGIKLAELLIQHGIGLNTVKRYEIKTVDSEYFQLG